MVERESCEFRERVLRALGLSLRLIASSSLMTGAGWEWSVARKNSRIGGGDIASRYNAGS